MPRAPRSQDRDFRALDASGTPQGRKTATEASAALKSLLRRDSELETLLLNRLERAGLPVPDQQFRFCPTRRWRADFAYPSDRLLIEVDGGIYSGGRHTRGSGFEADCEKTSTAAAMGYRVIRVTRRMIEDGRAAALIQQALLPARDAGEEEGAG